MKKFSKILSVALLVALVLSLGVASAFAQTVGTAAEGKGSITISNAAMGETYKVVKVFGATLTNDATSSTDATGIAYTGEIPSALTTYFEKDEAGNIHLKENADQEAMLTAVQTWAKGQTATAEAVSNGETLVFQGLDYGYYAVVSTQGATVTIDSTKPTATVIDKNTKIITGGKTVDDTSYSIGETINYTATFTTKNYVGDEQVKSYTISDTLPEFLTNVRITSVKIIQTTVEADKTDYPDVTLSYSAFTNKQIVIPWVDDADKSLYKNGSTIEIKYSAELTSTVNVNADNTNTVTIVPNKDKTGENPFNEHYDYDAQITTYAAALKKIAGTKDANGKEVTLAGAKFKFYGLNVTETASGIYTVSSYDPSKYDSTEGATQTAGNLGTEVEVGADGMLYIVGLKEGVTLHGIETKAPDGYNKLEGEIALTPQKLSEEVFHTEGTRYYDAKGNLVSTSESSSSSKSVEKNLSDLDAAALNVVNNKGTELPSTGGIGTTIFYVVGGVLVLAAIILLVTKKRMSE